MFKRRLVRWGLAAVLVLLAGLMAGVASLGMHEAQDRITRANAQRIAVGMTRSQVLEILGQPRHDAPPSHAVWQGREARIVVNFFSADRTVTEWWFEPEQASFFDRLPAWLGW